MSSGMSASTRWLTRANALTALRLLLAPLLYAAIVQARPSVAVGVFWLAVATDLADGWVARRFGEATPLGSLVDHAADATFATAGTAALVCVGALPEALPALIAIAFLQYALDSRRIAASGLRASALGRCNGIAYFVIVAVPLVRDALGLGWPGASLVRGLGWLLVGSTLLSMLDRLRWLLATRRARGSPA